MALAFLAFTLASTLVATVLVFTLKAFLGLLAVLVDKVFDGLSILDWLGLSLSLDRDQGNVVLDSSNNLLGIKKTSVEAFLLGDLQDGEVLTALTASNNAGDQGTLKSKPCH